MKDFKNISLDWPLFESHYKNIGQNNTCQWNFKTTVFAK